LPVCCWLWSLAGPLSEGDENKMVQGVPGKVIVSATSGSQSRRC